MTPVVSQPVHASARLPYRIGDRSVPVSWPASAFPIKYQVDRRVMDALPNAAVVLEHAFSTWSSAPDTNISFESLGVADGLVAGESDHKNTVTLADGLFKDQYAIAMTTNWYDNNGRLTQADIMIDSSLVRSDYNMQHAITLDLGPRLGLDLAAVRVAVMFPYVPRGSEAPSLDSDDKIAMQMLYPRIDSGGAILQGRVMGDSGGIFAAQVVALNDAGEPVATTLTSQDGSFEMRGVPPGMYRLYAEPLDGPVDVHNLSGNWRSAKLVSFPTEFADGGTIRIEGGKVYGNLNVNASGTTQLNPKWIGVFDPVQGGLTLNSTTVVLQPGQKIAVAIAGDGFVSGMTTFDVPNAGIKRVSDFTYAGNYVYATFTVAPDALPQSLVIFVKTGNQEAALTGGLRVAARARGHSVRH